MDGCTGERAALEDRIVQKAVADMILVPIHESEFLGISYGFRPGRGARNALDALTAGIEQRKIGWIPDADVRAFFGNLDRGWMIRFLEHRIGDRLNNRPRKCLGFRTPNQAFLEVKSDVAPAS